MLFQLFGMFFILGFITTMFVSISFVLALITRRIDLINITWGLGFVVIAVLSFLLSVDFSYKAFLATLLIIFWGVHISTILIKRMRLRGESYKFIALKTKWPRGFYLRLYLQVYLPYGFLMLLICSPVVIVNLFGDDAFSIPNIIGVVLWSIGFFIESVAVSQLYNFFLNSENKNKILTTGLWRYVRHPNYLGEIILWFGLFLLAVDSPYGYLSIISPMLTTLILVVVTGVPVTKSKFKDNSQYQIYSLKTPAIVPFINKRVSRM